MRRLAQRLAEALIAARAVPEADRALYEYAILCVLTLLAPLAVILLAGALAGMAAELFWFSLPFLFLRKFAGGLHMPTAWACFLASCAAFGGSAVLLSGYVRDVPALVGAACAAVLIAAVSPVDTANRRLSREDRRLFRRAARVALIVTAAVAGVMYAWEASRPYVKWIAGGVILTALLQLLQLAGNALAAIGNRRGKDREETE